MDIINAKIQADLSITSIEEGLYQLRIKEKIDVVLLVSVSHSFSDIFKIAEEMNFPFKNIDTVDVLASSSWFLIDHKNKKMYYSEGA